MRLVRQKTGTDCGVACLAMLAGISWAQARNVLFDRRHKKGFYTDKDAMRAALRRCGVIAREGTVRGPPCRCRGVDACL